MEAKMRTTARLRNPYFSKPDEKLQAAGDALVWLLNYASYCFDRREGETYGEDVESIHSNNDERLSTKG
jgi:hypothetical protein